jgi:hypothetical protein
MLDITNIVNRGNNIKIFSTPNTWQTWVKPRGAKTIDILCVGGGAGGGGGNAATTGIGGQGGSSSPFTRATFNAAVLPDILYIYTGAGGQGGTGAIGGGAAVDNTLTTGSISYVTATPDTGSSAGIICRSSNTPPIVGAAGTVATVANMVLINLATSYNTFAGQTSVTPVSTGYVSLTPTNIITAGATGTSTVSSTSVGGNGINAVGPIPGLLARSTPVSAPGYSGYVIYKPILAFIGGGGGVSISNNLSGAGNGGNGGPGAYGCGGGGGGAANNVTNSGNGGNGGKGGDGIVIITTICQ